MLAAWKVPSICCSQKDRWLQDGANASKCGQFQCTFVPIDLPDNSWGLKRDRAQITQTHQRLCGDGLETERNREILARKQRDIVRWGTTEDWKWEELIQVALRDSIAKLWELLQFVLRHCFVSSRARQNGFGSEQQHPWRNTKEQRGDSLRDLWGDIEPSCRLGTPPTERRILDSRHVYSEFNDPTERVATVMAPWKWCRHVQCGEISH